jgi:uncharacterized protein (DUF736 family)
MEKKNNSGALFINEQKNDKQPNYRGTALINGKEMKIAGWKRESKSGITYLSLLFEEPQAQKSETPFTDDIGF